MRLQKLLSSLTQHLRMPVRLPQMRAIKNLCIVNFSLIALIGGLVVLASGNFLVLFLTLTILVSTSLLIWLMLLKTKELNKTALIEGNQATGFENSPFPFCILLPSLQFSCGNKAARDACWWEENLPLLKKRLTSQESNAALDRLVDALYGSQERSEELHFKNGETVEVWEIHSIPLKDRALWHCQNATKDREDNSKHTCQLKNLTLFLDSAQDGLFSLNEKGNVLFCNEKFSKWLGYERDDIVGSSFSKFLVKPRYQDPYNLSELQGKCDFITSSSRIKTAFLEQIKVPCDAGFITYSQVNLHSPFTNQEELSKVLEMTPLPLVCVDSEGQILDSNSLFRENYWQRSIPIRGISFLNLVADFQKEEIKNALAAALDRKDDLSPIEIYFNDVQESIVSAYFAPLPLHKKRGLMIHFQDITEQKRFESQLVQSQKMQAVGQLAGGIAHDFNNLLTAMIGFCDLMLLRYTPGDQSFTDVMQIKQNANRAANLVRQLLAFSRQQTLQPKVLDITECLAELSALLRRLIGANIELNINHVRDLGLVLVDQGQFEQVIINMVVNARDAMEGGGTIALHTQNCELKKSKRNGHDVIPAGSYVLIEINDTGVGIKPEFIDRIFDPFFSTKDVGSGTGLGLSTVYGIVKQTGGFIHVDSTVDEGTTFSIYLPQYTPEAKEALEKPAAIPVEKTPQDLTGSNTILFVEDEDAVRVFGARALRSKGYKVIEAINGEEALNLINNNQEHIDLVISDVVMPQMDGPTFINEIKKLEVNPKVLFISGYAEETFHKQLHDDYEIKFLAKPFNLTDLAACVKDILSDEYTSLKSAS